MLPEKIRLAKEYVQRQSLRLDLAIICGTVAHLIGDHLPRLRRAPSAGAAKDRPG